MFSLHYAEGGVHAAVISSRCAGFPHGGRSYAALSSDCCSPERICRDMDLVPDSISGHIPGLPAASELEIDLSGAELLLTLHPIPMLRSAVSKETYRLDGSETNLSGYRKAKLAVTDSTMTVTTVESGPAANRSSSSAMSTTLLKTSSRSRERCASNVRLASSSTLHRIVGKHATRGSSRMRFFAEIAQEL